jgi:hypothetical protein
MDSKIDARQFLSGNNVCIVSPRVITESCDIIKNSFLHSAQFTSHTSCDLFVFPYTYFLLATISISTTLSSDQESNFFRLMCLSRCHMRVLENCEEFNFQDSDLTFQVNLNQVTRQQCVLWIRSLKSFPHSIVYYKISDNDLKALRQRLTSITIRKCVINAYA